MVTTGCSLILASNVGDTFSDANTTDIMLVATDCVVTGAMLLGFATTNGSAPLSSTIRIDADSMTTTGHLYAPSFSNYAGTTYTSTLRNAGPASFGEEVVMEHGIFGHGFSNTYDRTWVSRLEVDTAHVKGGLTVDGLVLGTGFSNVNGVTYVTTLAGATLANCRVPFSCITDVPAGLDSGTSVAAKSLGIGTNTPICALDVVGDMHATGAVYATSFVIVGGPGQSPGSTLGCQQAYTNSPTWRALGSNTYILCTATSNIGIGLSNPSFPLDVSVVTNFSNNVYLPGLSNVGGVTYMSNLVGATLAGCRVPYSCLVDVPSTGLGTALLGDIHTSGAVYASSFVIIGGKGGTASSLDALAAVSPTPMAHTDYPWKASSCSVSTLCNVGVGTTTPICAVDVVGDVHATGAMYASSFVIIGGGKDFGPHEPHLPLDVSVVTNFANDVFLCGMSNVKGVTFVSNLVGATLSDCSIPYSCLTGVPSSVQSASLWQGSASAAPAKAYMTTQGNIGVGVTAPTCAVDVAGDMHATGAVYASSFIIVGGTSAPTNATLSVPSPVSVAVGWRSDGANVLLGAFSNLGIGTANPSCAVDVVGHVHATGTVYASAFVVLPASPRTGPGLQVGSIPAPPNASRNLIVNGDFRVDQRGLGNSPVALSDVTGTYVVDRMCVDVKSGSGGVMVQVVDDPHVATDFPLPSGTFPKRLSITVATAAPIARAVPATPSYMAVTQRIEGRDLADLKWGTSAAAPVVVSFWIRSSEAGTYAVCLWNGKSGSGSLRGRTIAAPFTIPANVWTRVIIPFPGDSNTDTVPWEKGEVLGAVLSVVLSSRAVAPSPTGVWSDGQGTDQGVPGQTNLMDTLEAQVLITGLHLEQDTGSGFTPFVVEPYDVQLAQCQRQLCVISGGWQALMSVGQGGMHGTACISLLIPQRVVPSLSVLGPPSGLGVFQQGLGQVCAFGSASVWEQNYSTKDIVINGDWTSWVPSPTLMAGQVASMYLAHGTSLVLSAEL